MVGSGCIITRSNFLLILSMCVYIRALNCSDSRTSPGSRNIITNGAILTHFLTLLPNKWSLIAHLVSRLYSSPSHYPLTTEPRSCGSENYICQFGRLELCCSNTNTTLSLPHTLLSLQGSTVTDMLLGLSADVSRHLTFNEHTTRALLLWKVSEAVWQRCGLMRGTSQQSHVSSLQ